MKKNLSVKLSGLIAAFVFLIAGVLFMSVPVSTASADEPRDEYFYTPEPMGVTNENFVNTTGSTVPKNPSGWSGSALGGLSGTDVIAGVVSLSANDFSLNFSNKYKLSNLEPEITSSLRTPFSNPSNYSDADSNVLMIYNYGPESAYAYQSEGLNLYPNNYYRISVWVKTSDFTDGKGAHIRLSFDDKKYDVAFSNINTTNIAGLDGWVQYSMFIETGSFQNLSANLSLQVGHAYKGSDPKDTIINTAAGAAFFDRISAQSIDASVYYSAKQSSQNSDFSKFVSFKKIATTQIDNNDFESAFNFDADGWKQIPSENSKNTKYFGRVLTDKSDFVANKESYGLNQNPMSPQGGKSVLGIVNSANAAYGFRSGKFTIELHRYYVLSMMVKTLDNASATINVKGNNSKSADEFTESIAKSTTGSSNPSLFGWEAVTIFIQGSSLRDYEIYLELNLGVSGSPVKGSAFFDNIILEDITADEYSQNSGSASLAITMDNEATLTIPNGYFNLTANYDEDEYDYPLPARNWLEIEASNFGGKEVVSKDVKAGIINFDADHFAKYSANYGSPANPATFMSPDGPNALMIYSPTSTIYGYKSESFTIAANETKKLVTKLSTWNLSGAGVNLILKKDGYIISTIENIFSEGRFSEYTFYIQGGTSDSTLSLELWFGRPDGINNTKTSAGTVFFDTISFNDLAANEVYSQIAQTYREKSFVNNTAMDIDFAAYSFINEYFAAYDLREPSPIKTPYNWTLNADGDSISNGIVLGGIIDARSSESLQALNNSSFTNSGAQANRYNSLMLRNVSAAASSYTSINSETLAANEHYKISIMLKTTHIRDDQYGAWLKLVGTDSMIESVNTETRSDAIEGENPFKEYAFYVKTGDSAKSVSVSFGIGDANKSKNLSQGYIFISSIEYSTVNPALFDESVKAFVADEDEELEIPEGVAYLDLSAAIVEEEDDTTVSPADVPWWMIGSIIFGVAIVVALVGVPVKTLIAKRRVRVKTNESYDRVKTLEKIQKDNLARLKEKLAEREAQADELDDQIDIAQNEEEVQTQKSEPAVKENAEPKPAKDGDLSDLDD